MEKQNQLSQIKPKKFNKKRFIALAKKVKKIWEEEEEWLVKHGYRTFNQFSVKD